MTLSTHNSSDDGYEDSANFQALDPKEKKRYQNRVAQRTYRRNQKQRLRALEEAASRSANGNAHISAPQTTMSLPEIARNNSTPRVEQSFDLVMGDPLSNDLHTLTKDVISHEPALLLPWESITPPDEPDPKLGRTALHRAVFNGNENLCRLLLESGADDGRLDSDGKPPLHVAVDNGHDHITRLLLKSGNPQVTDAKGQTALFVAVMNQNLSATKLLLESSLDVNQADLLGEVALHIAVESGSEVMTRLLLGHGADINA